jgi:FMN phosphatase YigB (HAD superfamily)
MTMECKAPIAIFDLDNTIYDFASCYGGALCSLDDEIATVLGDGNFESGLARLGKMFRRFNSVEYWPSDVSEDEVGKRAARGWRELRLAFQTRIRASLEAYEGIDQVLSALRNRGVTLVAVSNAPIRAALARLQLTGQLGHFEEIYAWAGGRISAFSHKMWIDGKELDRAVASWGGTMIPHHTNALKPSSSNYRKIIAARLGRCQPDVTYVVGDSIQRDLWPAYEIDFHRVWAAYGTDVKPACQNALDAVTPWLKRNQSVMPFDFPHHLARSPSQIESLILEGKVES